SEFERLREELRRLGSLEARVERSSHLLTEITSGIGIAVAIPALAQSLDRIELVELADRRVLVVLITRDGMVRNRVVVLEDGRYPRSTRNLSEGWSRRVPRMTLFCVASPCCTRKVCWMWDSHPRFISKARAILWVLICTSRANGCESYFVLLKRRRRFCICSIAFLLRLMEKLQYTWASVTRTPAWANYR